MTITGTPTSGDDILSSDGAADTIIGNEGNDTITGGGGNDVIYGDVQYSVNGQFDSNQSPGTWGQGPLDGWSNSGSSGDIETWGSPFLGVSSTDGGPFIELDGDAGGGLDFITTNVELDTGVTYTISIDHAARAGASVNDDFEVVVNGVVIATVSPSTTSYMTTSTFTITGAAGTDVIGFREIAGQSNGLGILLNNFTVSLTEAEVAASSFTFDDSLSGGSGDDSIFGQEGDDTISGGTGTDVVEGGVGDDVFVVENGDGAMVVLDFTIGEDLLQLTNLQDSSGDPVNVFDVVVTSDGQGGSILTFPNGETITLRGIPPTDIDTPEELAQLGITCFAQGTVIETPSGPRPIETLCVGDRVRTRDHGCKPIKWIGSRYVSSRWMARDPSLCPIRFPKDTFGTGLPQRDLYLSPQHRLPIMGALAELMFAESEVLLPAKAFVGHGGIESEPANAVTYYHLMFDAHELVCSNGLWTESFFPGEMALNATDAAARAELFQLFPELEGLGGAAWETAAPALSMKEASVVVPTLFR